MATETTTPEATPEATVAETAPAPAADPTYPLAELKANSKALFGVQPEVIDGALYNNAQQEFSVSELGKIINTFLKRKVAK